MFHPHKNFNPCHFLIHTKNLWIPQPMPKFESSYPLTHTTHTTGPIQLTCKISGNCKGNGLTTAELHHMYFPCKIQELVLDGGFQISSLQTKKIKIGNIVPNIDTTDVILISLWAMGIGGGSREYRRKCRPMWDLRRPKTCRCKVLHICGLYFDNLHHCLIFLKD